MIQIIFEVLAEKLLEKKILSSWVNLFCEWGLVREIHCKKSRLSIGIITEGMKQRIIFFTKINWGLGESAVFSKVFFLYVELIELISYDFADEVRAYLYD